MTSLYEVQPLRAEAKVVERGRNKKAMTPYCGACDRKIAHKDQHRCPYVSCRKWFIGSLDVDETKRGEHA